MSLFRILAVLLACASAGYAQQTGVTPDPPATEATPEATPDTAPDTRMTLPRLMQIIQIVDPEARLFGNGAEFTLDGILIVVITDPVADRMRAMVPIRSAAGLSAQELMRLMQANFDTALDARYAVAQGRLWGVYIHPLSPLKREQFLSAIIQTINVARTYGSAYSGGAVTFGGGDSAGIYEELLKELLDKGQEL